MASFEISGLDEMFAKIKKMGQDLDSVKSKAIKKGAEVIRKEMSDRAPVGDKTPWQLKSGGGKNYTTEHLKDNIVISEVKKGAVEIGPQEDFYYAKLLEFGTVNMKPHPFAEAAYLSKRAEALEAMGDEIKKVIEGV